MWVTGRTISPSTRHVFQGPFMSLSVNHTDENNNKNLPQLLGAKHEAGGYVALLPSTETVFTTVPHCAHGITYCSPLPWYAMQVSMTSRVGSSSQRSYGMFPSELTASKSAPLQRKGQSESQEGVPGLAWWSPSSGFPSTAKC